MGLALSIRSTTAYERYIEGRKSVLPWFLRSDGYRYWAQIVLTVRNLMRLIWIHVAEREGDDAHKDDILGKLYGRPSPLILRFQDLYEYVDWICFRYKTSSSV